MGLPQQYLTEFSGEAQAWFNSAPFVEANYHFFQDFFSKEKLAKAEWPDFQAMRPHIHSFNEVPLAGANALGRPNHEIEYYRRSFLMLAHDDAPLADRIDRFDHGDHRIKFFGKGAISEILASLFPEQCHMYNERDRKGAAFLGIKPISKGLSFGKELLAFADALGPLRKAYLEIVGKQTDLPLNLETDQFLSWVYQERMPPPPPKPRERIMLKVAPGELASFWDKCTAKKIIAVGWNEIGDLRQFAKKEDLRAFIAKEYKKGGANQRGSLTREVEGLWAFRNLQCGDLVVANRGQTEVLAVGTVLGDGYFFMPGEREFRHRVGVEWDLSYARTVQRQHDWRDTIVRLKPEIAKLILGGRYWLFQANPRIWNLAEHMATWQIGALESWSLSRYVDAVKPGDEVALWQAGPDAGLHGYGEIASEAFEREDGKLAVEVKLTEKLAQPLLRTQLAAESVLSQMQVIRAPQGTNFSVTEQEWHALRAFPGPKPDSYEEPEYKDVRGRIARTGLKIDDRTLRRYHLSLKTRKFVILSGISGTGKTWLAEEYAKAVGAHLKLVPVAPDWTSNEDLLGYFNPLDNSYKDTPFSHFLREASQAWKDTPEGGRACPYHLILDEMNLARVEYYFARFLSEMEVRQRYGSAELELGPNDTVTLPPNLFFVGTVNIDETTHGFADKVFDRAQVVELHVNTDAMRAHLLDAPHSDALMDVFELLKESAPFGFRVADEIGQYIAEAKKMGVSWEQALDEQLLQKVLPKLAGASAQTAEALTRLHEACAEHYPLSSEKAKRMREGYDCHGFATYF